MWLITLKHSLIVDWNMNTSFDGVDAFESNDINLDSSHLPPNPSHNFDLLAPANSCKFSVFLSRMLLIH